MRTAIFMVVYGLVLASIGFTIVQLFRPPELLVYPLVSAIGVYVMQRVAKGFNIVVFPEDEQKDSALEPSDQKQD